MSRFYKINLELLEPYDAKVSRTVLRGESSRKGADLLDQLKSSVIIDELPTIYFRGLDNLIATARSNKVAVCLGFQDFSQLYSKRKRLRINHAEI